MPIPAEQVAGAHLLVIATFDALPQLWTRLSTILAIIGVLTWLSTLFESAVLRRRLPPAASS